jgi:hypothetical protein
MEERSLWAKEGRGPIDAGKGKKMDIPQGPQKEHDPADTLILGQ